MNPFRCLAKRFEQPEKPEPSLVLLSAEELWRAQRRKEQADKELKLAEGKSLLEDSPIPGRIFRASSRGYQGIWSNDIQDGDAANRIADYLCDKLDYRVSNWRTLGPYRPGEKGVIWIHIRWGNNR